MRSFVESGAFCSMLWLFKIQSTLFSLFNQGWTKHHTSPDVTSFYLGSCPYGSLAVPSSSSKLSSNDGEPDGGSLQSSLYDKFSAMTDTNMSNAVKMVVVQDHTKQPEGVVNISANRELAFQSLCGLRPQKLLAWTQKNTTAKQRSYKNQEDYKSNWNLRKTHH